jgi:hypothetical protein
MTFEQFTQEQQRLYRKLLYWAGKQYKGDPSEQIKEYFTELVFEADPKQDNTALLKKWARALTQQERNVLAYLSPITISDYDNTRSWYKFEPGEYTVLREKLLHGITYQGQERGLITRNRYGCLVLNTETMLIVDVDLGVPSYSPFNDCARNSQIALNQFQAIAALEAVAEQFPKMGFRVYRTRNGLRYICTTQEADPTASNTHKLMQNLYADPLYMRLCKFQATFRARLTPKPWRVEYEAQRFIYDRPTGMVLPESSPYATCHLIEIIGEQEIIPEFEEMIQVHDSYCRVSRLGLELA